MTPEPKPATTTGATMVKKKTEDHPFEKPNVLPMNRKSSPIPTRTVCSFMIPALLSPLKIIKCYKMLPRYRLPSKQQR